MEVHIEKSNIQGEVYAPSSKSYTHRALTIGLLSNNTTIYRPLLSNDTKSTIYACKMFGADIKIDDHKIVIKGVNGAPKIPDDVINIGNSGTTLRFMTSISSLTDGITVLTGDESIRARPNDPLLKALSTLGVQAFSTRNNGCAPLVIKSGFKGGHVEINGSISSQFISSLLLTCPLQTEDVTINVNGKLKSKPYVDITLQLIEKSGVHIINDNYSRFCIKAGQIYNLNEYTVPGDFSSASYILAAAAILGNGVTVRNLYPSSQGDMYILDILKKMGADVQWNKSKGDVAVRPSNLKGITIDVSSTPDLVPTIAVLAAVADGKTIITNAEHVRYKETDRLHAMNIELSKMGINVVEKKDELIIMGGKLKSASLDGWHDHRIVMALTIAGLVAGNTTITKAESVSISYPNFFDDLRDLGALIQNIY
ncbi:3-phosphoshikimate 1-carboxyvinyltransferase [Methanosalsum natronophilum]|uniref:3-phosphoshikimate 1-carboxyvinyltransferase n=1 Tax=Methanosalsum natronophilum TaxID=768733 RepID=UPI002167F3EE|nr:3-phosphoshikimate 1-carboxyvinyltransferase [Methanosalsum natronophilum]MCS3924650.1 3-phosphoshikimate 1-carboxyvinyltransferase [Methanosalsum natronophilum]